MPLGERRGAIENAEIAALLAKIVVAWPHIEDLMIKVFERLIGVDVHNHENGRLIFTAIVNQKIRIDLMRTLLHRSRVNRDMDQIFDTVIDEYQRLNDLRNKYIHGRWWTHENGDTYLQVDNSEQLTHVVYRKVTTKELEDYCQRLALFGGKVCLQI